MSDRKAFLFLLVIALLISAGIATAANSAAIQMTPTPAPTSTYIQFPCAGMDGEWQDIPYCMMTATPEVPIYIEMPTPVPFADMPLLYFYDEAHDTDCWVTFNHMAVSCLRRPAFWPCEARAER